MTEDTSRLYLYVKDWDEHQPRSDRPNMPWLRLHTKLLGNVAWLGLSCDDRCLLLAVWMLAQRYGNGCLMADQRWLMAQANVPFGARSKNLERLVQAGFVTLSTTKAEPNGGLEEKRIEKEKKRKPVVGAKEAPAGFQRRNGAREKIQCPEHKAELISMGGGSPLWQCPAPACRFTSESRWTPESADAIADIRPHFASP